jgi:hypothetical protein
MQRYKSLFKDPSYKGTITNIQSCLRLNDLEEIGDGQHSLSFDMLGLFSFNEMSVLQSIDFWMEFLHTLGLKPDYVTIHPDRIDWQNYYSKYDVDIRLDNECVWSDGSKDSELSYCTEFYINNIEIGNIVNPFGTSIDCGFGLSRIEMILNNIQTSKEETLRETIFKIINSGYLPTYNKQGSILRKLLRICYLEGIVIEHKFYEDEILRQQKIIDKYHRMKEKPKFQYKDKEWWFNTLGLDIDLLK